MVQLRRALGFGDGGTRWRKLIRALKPHHLRGADPINSRLRESFGFGSNPGNLRMFSYCPPILAGNPSLVVVLHGCTQTAAGYDVGTGWSTLADRYGLVRSE